MRVISASEVKSASGSKLTPQLDQAVSDLVHATRSCVQCGTPIGIVETRVAVVQAEDSAWTLVYVMRCENGMCRATYRVELAITSDELVALGDNAER